MNKKRQLDFFENNHASKPGRNAHGGGLGKGKRKIARPLDRRRPVHLTLKSSHAKGELSLKRKVFEVETLLRVQARRFQVRIHEFANVGNHLHLVASFKSRQEFQGFLRAFSGLAARLVTGARRGKPFGKRFWDELVFSRVLFGRQSFVSAIKYVGRNIIESRFGTQVRRFLEAKEREFLREKTEAVKSLASG